MKIKKQNMMAKFEKLLTKGKLMSKEEFYKHIFSIENETYSINIIYFKILMIINLLVILIILT
jgi:hypothetical protein